MDPDHYLLRLAEIVRIGLASSLGIPVYAIGSVKSWVEELGKCGLFEFLEDDHEDCQENGISGLAGKLMEVMSGMEYNRIPIPLRMPGYRQ